MTDHAHGFHVNVYRNGVGDCTNGGVSAKANRLTVVGILDGVGTGVPGARPAPPSNVSPLEPGMRMHPATDDAPAVALAVDHLFGDVEQPRLALVPVRPADNGGWVRDDSGHVMFGGNFAHAGDSRWSRLVCEVGGLNHPAPVALHDRVEQWRQ